MKKCSPSRDPAKLGPTCLVMTTVLKRDADTNGIGVSEMFQTLPAGRARFVPVIVYRGRKVKDKVFVLSVCPWCGASILPTALKVK